MSNELPLDVYSKSWVMLMTLLEKRLYWGWSSRHSLDDVYKLSFGKELSRVEYKILTNVLRGSALIMRVGKNHFWPLGCRLNKFKNETEVFINTGEIAVWDSMSNTLQTDYVYVDEAFLYDYVDLMTFKYFFHNNISAKVKEKIDAGELQDPWTNADVLRAIDMREKVKARFLAAKRGK